jgi:transposase
MKLMKRFVEGASRLQSTLFPDQLDDYIVEDNPVRVIDVFVDEMDLCKMGFKVIPADTGRPSYHPATMLKIYIYALLSGESYLKLNGFCFDFPEANGA